MIPHAPGQPDVTSGHQSESKPVSHLEAPGQHFDPLSIIPITPQQYVQMEAAKYGWDTGNQWEALNTLIFNESGWQTHVLNSSSGACGLFQSLPCSKLGAPLDNVANQARWGLAYIKGTYGSPGVALSQWNARYPHWY